MNIMSIKRPLLPAMLLVVIWQKPVAAMPPGSKKVPSTSTKSLFATITRSALLFCRNNDIWEVRKGVFRRLIRNAHDPAWSNQKDKIAFVRQGNVWICDAAGRYQRPITPFKLTKQQLKNNNEEGFNGVDYGAIQSLSWYPTGNIVAFSRVDQYTISRNVPSSMSSPLSNDIGTNTTRLISDIYACLPYTNRVPTTFVWLSDSTSGLPRFSLPYTAVPAFCPTGKRVAFARNGDLWLAYDLNVPTKRGYSSADATSEVWADWDWREERVTTAAIYDGGDGGANSTTFINHITWSPNCKLIAYSVTGLDESGNGNITYLYNLKNHVRKRLSAAGDYPAFSPDGLFIALNRINYDPQLGGIVCKSINGRVRFVITSNGCDPAW